MNIQNYRIAVSATKNYQKYDMEVTVNSVTEDELCYLKNMLINEAVNGVTELSSRLEPESKKAEVRTSFNVEPNRVANDINFNQPQNNFVPQNSYHRPNNGFKQQNNFNKPKLDPNAPATDKQLTMLSRYGYYDTQGLTVAQASQLINQYKSR